MAAKIITKEIAAKRVKVYGFFNFVFRAVVPAVSAILIWGAVNEPTEPVMPAWLAAITPESFETIYYQALDILGNLAFGSFAAGAIVLLEMRDKKNKIFEEFKIQKKMVFAKNHIVLGTVIAIVAWFAYLVAMKLALFGIIFAGSSAVALVFETAQNKCKLIINPINGGSINA